MKKILSLILALTCLSVSAAPQGRRRVRPAAEKEKPAANSKAKEKEKENGKKTDKEKEKPKANTKEKEQDQSRKDTEKPDAPKEPDAEEAKTASLKPEELEGFASLPVPVQERLRYALSLTARQLSYKTGSADPETGGTDCSGFVYHVLQTRGHTGVPRQSDEMYAWTWKAGTFRACNGVTTDTFEFKELRAGDLLFWVNSTRDGKTSRNPPVTHVMFYLGKRASDGKPLAAGASDGRTYDGQRMSGVSVFDFRLPSADSHARFIGYAHVPAEGMTPEKKEEVKPAMAKPKVKEKPKAKGGKGSGRS